MKEVEQHRWPPLYKKAKDGKITEWNVWVTGKTIYTTSGVVGQKMRETKDVVPAGKNIGRRNETTAHEQAVLEAQAKVDKKIDNGYVWEKESALEGKVEKQVAGGFYPMLAFAYDKHGAKIQYPCYVNPKLDGLRAIAIEGQFFSRMRKPFPVIKHLQEEIEKHPSLMELPLDGELYHHDLKEDFELIVSAIKREKEPSPLTQSIQYHVYDLNIPGHYHERLETIERLKLTIKSKAIKFVETRLVKNEREMRAAYEDFMEQGYEGAMLRNAHGQYECRRSYNLQKVKEFQDTEFRIVDIQEGRGALQGCVGAFVCEMQETKATFNVKLKGKDVTALLRRCFTDHSLWKSRWITVQHQGFTKNGLPRFPVGVRLRGAE